MFGIFCFLVYWSILELFGEKKMKYGLFLIIKNIIFKNKIVISSFK